MENRFLTGEEVHAKSNPAVALIVRRYVNRIYYCKLKGISGQDDLVYFERELIRTESANNS